MTGLWCCRRLPLRILGAFPIHRDAGDLDQPRAGKIVVMVRSFRRVSLPFLQVFQAHLQGSQLFLRLCLRDLECGGLLSLTHRSFCCRNLSLQGDVTLLELSDPFLHILGNLNGHRRRRGGLCELASLGIRRDGFSQGGDRAGFHFTALRTYFLLHVTKPLFDLHGDAGDDGHPIGEAVLNIPQLGLDFLSHIRETHVALIGLSLECLPQIPSKVLASFRVLSANARQSLSEFQVRLREPVVNVSTNVVIELSERVSS
mmetsp:Transcript_69486/g.151234  ORF Transcript_69486/g.151234 Transcript_69486/m.151234 type:complete len:258 (-) Transcript_69486:132-905(-)